MKSYIFLFFVFLFNNFIFSQTPPTIEWQKTLGGSGYETLNCVQQTSDGGYILAGNTTSNNGDVINNHGGIDCWVVKINSSGTILWTKTFGGLNDDDIYAIQQTTDGGYIFAGSTFSNNGDVSGNHGSSDFWVVKLNETGLIIWQKTLGGTSTDFAYDIQQTSDGGYIVIGNTQSNNGDVSGNHGGTDFWVVKLNTVGTIIWQKALGGTSSDTAYSVQETTDGGYILAGQTLSNNDGDVSPNHGNNDFWIVKLNNSGNITWQKAFGGTNNEIPYKVLQTSDSGYVVAGFTVSNDGDVSGNHGSGDFWIVKLNTVGSIIWQKSLGGSFSDFAYDMQKTADGGYILTGISTSNDGNITGNHGGGGDFWVVKIDSAGSIVWQKSLGGSNRDDARSIQQTMDGGYIISGTTESNNGDITENKGLSDFWIVKLSPENLSNSNFETSKISIYPNPSTTFLTIQSTDNSDEICNYTIIDVKGVIVKKGQINYNQIINIENLPSGNYIFQVELKTHQITRKKTIKL